MGNPRALCNALAIAGTAYLTLFPNEVIASSPAVEAIYENGARKIENQFSELVAVPAHEQRILITRVRDGSTTEPGFESDAFYTYSNGILTFTYRADYQSNVLSSTPPEPLRYWNKILIDSGFIETGSFMGETGIGRKMRVQTFMGRALYALTGMSKSPEPITGSVSYALGPKEAEALARVATIQVELKDASALSGQSDCSIETRPADIRRPIEVTSLLCVVRAEVSSINLTRSDTGEIIHPIYRAEP